MLQFVLPIWKWVRLFAWIAGLAFLWASPSNASPPEGSACTAFQWWNKLRQVAYFSAIRSRSKAVLLWLFQSPSARDAAKVPYISGPRAQLPGGATGFNARPVRIDGTK